MFVRTTGVILTALLLITLLLLFPPTKIAIKNSNLLPNVSNTHPKVENGKAVMPSDVVVSPIKIGVDRKKQSAGIAVIVLVAAGILGLGHYRALPKRSVK